ncbi:MAG: hypothetical protein ABIS21_01765 [Acidimicrobiales bacterium]
MTSDPKTSVPAANDGPGKTPAPLVLSCVFGALGVVLIIVGLAASVDAVALAGVGAGVLSLSAALFWRSELVSSWAAAKRPRRP